MDIGNIFSLILSCLSCTVAIFTIYKFLHNKITKDTELKIELVSINSQLNNLNKTNVEIRTEFANFVTRVTKIEQFLKDVQILGAADLPKTIGVLETSIKLLSQRIENLENKI